VNEAVRIVMSNLEITGGASGLRLLQTGRFSQAEHYYAALGIAALAFLVSWRVMHSPFGLALRAIREDQDAAADVGRTPVPLQAGRARAGGLPDRDRGRSFVHYSAYIHPTGCSPSPPAPPSS